MRHKKTVCLCASLLLVVLSTGARAQGPACSTPQSPRNVDPKTAPYDGRSTTSIVRELSADSIVYTPRAGGAPTTLYRCGQHYHFPIETPEGCAADAAKAGKPAKTAKAGDKAGAKPGDRIEIHTVFAAKVRHDGCDPETLDCCLEAPFLVRAFAAKVTPGGTPGPIAPPPGRPLAEWSGSTTGKETSPNECKPAAQWSFRLGCGYTVSEGQLSQFHHFDPARPVQSGPRVSKDLTLVTP
jgi:hypothetical protein